ncbi:hypothetical protein STFR1_40259 [Bacillus vallismortis]
MKTKTSRYMGTYFPYTFLAEKYKNVKIMEVFPLAKIYRKTLSLYDYHIICDCNRDILLNASSTGRAIFR